MKLNFFALREAARALKKPLSEAQTILEADLSHDETATALRNYLRVHSRDLPYSWKYVRAIYDTYFVYEESGENGVDRLWRADYALDENGTLTVGTPLEVSVEVKYVTVDVPAVVDATVAEAQKPIHEAFIGAIKESFASDGTALIKLIDPGIGSTGYYGADVLKEAAQAKIIPSGTQMFGNHMTQAQRDEQPEGDVYNKIGVTLEDARWIDADTAPAGAGLYAKSKIMQHHRPFVESMKDDMGVSIDGTASIAWGEVEGRQMPIIEKLLAVNSVDFVTRAGRGGQIVSLQEAARQNDFQKAKESAKTDPTPQPLPNPTSEETQVTEAEAQKMAGEQAARAVENYRSAQSTAREAVNGLALPDAIKNRIVEAQTKNLPLKEGALDAQALSTRVKDAAAEEAKIAKEAYGWGDGAVVNPASEAATVATRESATADDGLGLTFARLGL